MRNVVQVSSVTAMALAICMHPSVALACSVCFLPSEMNRGAYLGTTVFLSLLPLALMAGSIYWIVRQYKAAALRDHALLPEQALEGNLAK
jgi:hypothetical protein